MDYLLSVIIPTKNRYKYLKGCLSCINSIDSDEIEVIVQDNTEDNTEILEFLEKNKSENIKYYHSTTNVSQSENSDNAVSKATGEYCVYIGDDDTITDALLDAVRYMNKHKIKACVCDMAHYYWPDVVFEGKRKPSLSFDCNKVKIQTLNADTTLKKVLKQGALDIKYLARVYHGIIHRSILQEVYDKTGSYFPGPSPDMANAVACTLLLDQYIYINYPLILSGVGYGSAAGMGQRGAHKGSLKDAKQLPQDAIDNWSDKIPKIWLGYTVWPESAEKALMKMGAVDELKMLNYIAPEARTFLKFPEYRKIIKPFINTFFKKIKFIFELLHCGMIVLERKIVKIKKRINHIEYINNTELLIDDALNIVNKQYIKDNNNHVFLSNK